MLSSLGSMFSDKAGSPLLCLDPAAGADPRIGRGDGYVSDGEGSVLGSGPVALKVEETLQRGSFGRMIERVSKGAGAIPGLVHEGLEASDSPPRDRRRGGRLVRHGECSVLGSGLVAPNVGEYPPRGSSGQVFERLSEGAGAVPCLGHVGIEARGSSPRGPRRGNGLVSHGEDTVLGSGPVAPKVGESSPRGSPGRFIKRVSEGGCSILGSGYGLFKVGGSP